MKRLILFFMSMTLAGCVTIAEDAQVAAPSTGHKLVSLRQVLPGMSEKEVQTVLGGQVVVGYILNEEIKQYNPITLKNPYRLEMIKKGTTEYQVHYYFVSIKQEDDKIADDELEPLVFKDGKLVGKGWAFFHSIGLRP
ncbi:MAG: DUF3192 domain-containing protein [Candidatus Omnitrophica bacterium]|nr:DUF3192 domain-containing protein [Candidatus Omnitrophota bacterium]